MSQRDLVVIGASAGGLQALTAIFERLPTTLAASVVVVLHTSAEADGLLPGILARVSALPVSYAADRVQPAPGHIYVAPPDRHVIIDDHHLRVVHGPRENGFRPAVDPHLEHAAERDQRRRRRSRAARG
ncbi:MAG TPA: chemotaxis protein CheB [Vicinamibacterales bacterium]|nr:chemotaxis protein CheB [Vicinamibacterales bacterium]